MPLELRAQEISKEGKETSSKGTSKEDNNIPKLRVHGMVVEDVENLVAEEGNQYTLIVER